MLATIILCRAGYVIHTLILAHISRIDAIALKYSILSPRMLVPPPTQSSNPSVAALIAASIISSPMLLKRFTLTLLTTVITHSVATADEFSDLSKQIENLAPATQATPDLKRKPYGKTP